MTYDVEYLFICLFAICVSSLVRCLFRSHAHFKIGLFVLLLLSFKSSLYILDTSTLWNIYFQIFSPRLWLVFLFCEHFLSQSIHFVCFILFLAALGLSCGARDLHWGMWDLSLWRVVFSLVMVCGLLSSCGTQAPEHVGSVVYNMWLSRWGEWAQ